MGELNPNSLKNRPQCSTNFLPQPHPTYTPPNPQTLLQESTPLIKHMHENICRKLLDGHYQKNDKFDTNMETKDFS